MWLRATEDFEAWSWATRGADLLWRGTAADMAEARSLLERAVNRDPRYAKALALIALTHYFDIRFGYASDPEESMRKHAEFTERALALNPDEPYGLHLRAGIRAYEGCFDEALVDANLAVTKGPGDALCWLRYARVLIWLERSEEGEAAARHAMRLNPLYPIFYDAVLGDAILRQGRADEAIKIFQQILQRQPKYHSALLYLASAYVSLGQIANAKSAMKEALRINPGYSVRSAELFYLSSDESLKEAFLDRLRTAGLP
jgi:adenylate cyclase